MTIPDDDKLEITPTSLTAQQFINSTQSHIFLTGKAGTGKTTFLKNLSKNTHKTFVIVAPTGIAALNAGGVTIHAQFLLPFGLYWPSPELPETDSPVYNAHLLTRKHPLNSNRKKILRSIDLLVIDEVSMLRADLLDAIDFRLKAARGNYQQRFGGVQLLLIGDLYQLPPVVRGEEEGLLRKHYSSPWFFDAESLKENGFTYIELEKIFRQREAQFINLLNNLRHNSTTQENIGVLNHYVKTQEEINTLKEIITLTTHNYKADEINQKALNHLDAKAHLFSATITGNFPESMYPVQSQLTLKVGAQIMFIKNDSESKKYFNGKLATVVKIQDGLITVEMAGDQTSHTLKKEVWENKQYLLNKEKQEIEEEVLGTFEQYPIKLAWAITIHKSQGLTFDKAIIDIQQAFADGQVYVALSRLRSLNGLVLRAPIKTNIISTDAQVVGFTQQHHQPELLPQVMIKEKKAYLKQLINSTFDFQLLIKDITYVAQKKVPQIAMEEETMQSPLTLIKNTLQAEGKNTHIFRMQLSQLLETNDHHSFIDRVKSGSQYYSELIQDQLEKLLAHTHEIQQMKRVKVYLNHLEDFEVMFTKKLETLDKISYLVKGILHEEDTFDFSQQKEHRQHKRDQILQSLEHAHPSPKQKKKSKEKGSTFETTLQLFNSGLSVEEIAKERNLVKGTIEGHLAKWIASGHVKIDQFMDPKNVAVIAAAIAEMKEEFSLSALFNKFNGQYSYGQLRAVLNHTRLSEDATSDHTKEG